MVPARHRRSARVRPTRAPVAARLCDSAGRAPTSINGQLVGDEVLAPSGRISESAAVHYTSEAARCRSKRYQRRSVRQAVPAETSPDPPPQCYGDSIALLAQLRSRSHGTTVTFAPTSGGAGGWRHPMADIYDGCDRDLRRPAGLAGRRVRRFRVGRVDVVPLPAGLAGARPPVRELLTLAPRATLADRTTALDMGQNLTGWLRIGPPAWMGEVRNRPGTRR
jgi:hypothetical protein